MPNRLLISAGMLMVAMLPAVASAHVVVKPVEVGVATFQTFTAGVPNEKNQPVTVVRLVLPASIKEVAPTVKPGWTIQQQTTGSGGDLVVTEISWTGGQIPAGQRDDFTFSAQAPAAPGELHWKAYQAYADGTVVSWDQAPAAGHDHASTTPYSITKVVNDLAADPATAKSDDNLAILALALSTLAVGMSAFALRRR